jgi:tripartite-type tricarboxylate transporter receptor subunit TctC
MRRSIFVSISAISVLALCLAGPCAYGQAYPNRPVQMIMSIPAGGGGDVNGRILVEELKKVLGQPVIVSNKPGASDTIGTDALAKSRKDGYTIGYTSSAAMVYARVITPETVPYDPVKDFYPLALHTFFPLAVAVQANSPWKTFDELIDYAKKNPGRLRVSTAGVASTANFNVEIIQSLTGAKFTSVPFKGGEEVITALLGGHVEVSLDIVGKFEPHVESGRVRLLLVSKKVSIFPKLPVLTELKYSRNLLSGWHAIFAPAGVPQEVAKVLVPAIEKAAKHPEGKAKIERTGYAVEYMGPEDLRKLIMDDYETAKGIAVKLGLSK